MASIDALLEMSDAELQAYLRGLSKRERKTVTREATKRWKEADRTAKDARAQIAKLTEELARRGVLESGEFEVADGKRRRG